LGFNIINNPNNKISFSYLIFISSNKFFCKGFLMGFFHFCRARYFPSKSVIQVSELIFFCLVIQAQAEQDSELVTIELFKPGANVINIFIARDLRIFVPS
jgi:hypothetical protein